MHLKFNFIISWILANTLTWILSSYISLHIGFSIYSFLIEVIPGSLPGTMYPNHQYKDLFAIFAYLVGGTIFGALTGKVQQVLLYKYFRVSIEWLLLNALGWGIGLTIGWSIIVISDIQPLWLLYSILYLFGGIISSAFIYAKFAELKQTRKARWWFLCNSIGWSIGSLIGVAIALSIQNDLIRFIVTPTIIGFVGSILTGMTIGQVFSESS